MAAETHEPPYGRGTATLISGITLYQPVSPANPAAKQSLPQGLNPQTASCLHTQISPPACTTGLVVVEGTPNEQSQQGVLKSNPKHAFHTVLFQAGRMAQHT